MEHVSEEMQAEIDKRWSEMPEEWRSLPDDEVTACGMPLGLVHPEIYGPDNKTRPE